MSVAQRGLGIQRHFVSGDHVDIMDADKAQNMPRIAGGKTDRGPNSRAACGDGQNSPLALQQTFGAACGIGKGPSRASVRRHHSP